MREEPLTLDVEEFDRDGLLDEALEIATSMSHEVHEVYRGRRVHGTADGDAVLLDLKEEKATLGPGSEDLPFGFDTSEAQDQRVRSTADVVAVLRDLKQEKASFGPCPEVLPLGLDTLEARGIVPDHRVRTLLECFDFYSVTFPITLFPKRGWAFDRLECQVEFNPGESAERRPLAHDIFPSSSWETLARAQLKLEVGVTEGLEFRTPTVDAGVASAEVAGKLAAGARFVFPPRDYHVKRARILSRGKDDCEVLWRLDDAEFFEEDEPRLGVVLKVPRGVDEVRASGLLAAYRSFRMLSSNLGDLLGYLNERARNFFQKGAPLVDRGQWGLDSTL